MTTLREIIANLDRLDDQSTIYARIPWSPESEATVEREPDEGGLPEGARNSGMSYFLEVFLARDVLSSWAAALPQPPSLDQRCDRLAHYALYDA